MSESTSHRRDQQLQLRIALTFDHELSLGGARDYHLNLFDPTDKLLETAAQLDVPVTLFTDILSAVRFREWDHANFFVPYEQQIRRALEMGHDVQLHIHPHWIDSDFRENTFVPAESYCLADFRDRAPPDDTSGIIHRSFAALTDLCQAARPDYRCVAYRGGGYNLEPETKTILSTLYQLGIRIDSTIAKGMYYRSRVNRVDYRQMPSKANWFIATNGRLNEAASHGILEVPIASMPRRVPDNIRFLLNRLLHRDRVYRSTGYGIKGQTSTMFDKIRRLFPETVWTVSFDSPALSAGHVFRTLRYFVRQHAADELIMCAACSHPKSMGPYQRGVMAEFVESVRRHFGASAEFVTFRQLSDQLELA